MSIVDAVTICATLAVIIGVVLLLYPSIRIIMTDCAEHKIRNKHLFLLFCLSFILIIGDATLRFTTSGFWAVFLGVMQAFATAIVITFFTLMLALLPSKPLGMGDVKLLFVTTFIVANIFGVSGVLCSLGVFACGVAVTLIVVKLVKRSVREIPLAPAIIAGLWGSAVLCFVR